MEMVGLTIAAYRIMAWLLDISGLIYRAAWHCFMS